MKNPKAKTYSLNGVAYPTITGMAEKLDCSEQTVQRKVAQRKISHFYHKRRLLFPLDAADEYIKNLIVSAEPYRKRTIT